MLTTMRTETLEIACYGLFVGLFGLLLWEGWQTRNAKWTDGPVDQKGWTDLRQKLREQGENEQPTDERWKFTSSYLDWWKAIETANWTGKVPPKPVERVDEPVVEEGPKPEALRPLTEIFELKTILANGIDDDLQGNRIKIQYKDPNVQPPKSDYATPALVAAGGNTVATSSGLPFHDLVVGETLWAPYDSIKFTHVDLAMPAAVFSRPAPDGKGETVEEKVWLSELGLSDKHIDPGLISEMGAKRRVTAEAAGTSAKPWVDPGDRTQEIDQNLWMISNKDTEAIATNYERILTEDFQLQDYQARRPGRDGKRMRGVSFRRVSPDVARFGIKAGDVLVAVNGKPVTSRASAIKVGKADYERGVRNFELTFISGGRKVQRSYRAPDKR